MNIATTSPIAPSIAAGGCVMPPSSTVTHTYGRHLTALGAGSVDATDATTVRVGFGDVARGVTAANLLEDSIFGAKLVFELPATGIPFQMTSSDVVAALRSLPGVATVVNQMMVDRPLISVMAASAQDAATLQPLLRDSVQLQGRGGMQDVRIEVLTDSPVVPFNQG